MAGSSRPNRALTVLKLLGVLVVTGVLAAGVLLPYVGGIGLVARQQGAKFLDQPCNLTETPPPLRSTLYARDGKTPIANLFDQDRQPVSLAQMPKVLQQALIATEDRRFFSHQGVDMRGLIRSALNTSSGDTQGGSTLTMQYVKQERYYQALDDPAKQAAAVDQNINRKIQDAKCAIEIEKKETKQQILDNYLNIAFFGEHSYGIATAAQTFFGVAPKDLHKLTLAQSAMLVGMLRAPSQYDPFINKKPSMRRRDQVIDNLLSQGQITAAQAAKAKADPGNLATTAPPDVREGCASSNPAILNAGFFCDYVTDWLTDAKKGNISDPQLRRGGFSIVTTLDPALQNSTQRSISTQLPPTSPMTAIQPVVDPQTGDVKAMATSKLYGAKTNPKDNTHTALPIFTNPTTGAASTYKYFSMIAALKAGATPELALGANSPDHKQYQTSSCSAGSYVARNTEGQSYLPNETMASAIAKSSNTYFVALEDQFFNQCSIKPIVDTALGLGMSSLNDQVPPTKQTYAQQAVAQAQATFTLGQNGTSPLELTGAYGAAAHDGVFCAPAPILSIKDHSGKELAFTRTPCATQMSPQIARTAVQMLVADTKTGTAVGPFQSYYGQGGSEVAGKTGTNNDKTDKANSSLWFVGVTPTLVATTALINLDHPSDAISGLPGMSNEQAANTLGAYAAQIWVNSLTPTVLQSPRWAWPGPNDIPNAIPVQSVIGKSAQEATQILTAQGFKVVDVGKGQPACGSSAPFYSVGYQQPAVAVPGDTVTICLSNGRPLYTYLPPPPPPKPVVRPTIPPPLPAASPTRKRPPH
ncbi:MAG: penicillin-binding protein [Actinomycetota bacterium]